MITKRRVSLLASASILAALACTGNESARSAGDSAAPQAAAVACPGDNGGLTLPNGFCATVFADSIGHARHIAVGSNGDVYVNTWSGRYYTSPPPAGGFLVAMRDTNNDGRADIIARFGGNPARGGRGGTGIGLYKGSLYAEEGTTIVRFTLSADSLAPSTTGERIVTGLSLSGDHPIYPFAIDAAGNMYMNSGSATNSCQIENRILESAGRKPCTELLTRGGIWRYDANRANQRYSPAERYATGIRNAVGITIGPDGGVYATQHGRDQLRENWLRLYTVEQGQNLPAEQLLRIQQGADYGWPMCYFDGAQQKLVLAPEYGGDGGKAIGACVSKAAPIAFFPAHWAPDAVLFYTGSSFPAHYRGGAFIAFHGSWNRAPGPQQGYNLVFVPFAGGNPTSASKFEVFADGFAGGKMQPDAAAHRPVGLAQAPDGALFITDDKAGRVWRVTYGTGAK